MSKIIIVVATNLAFALMVLAHLGKRSSNASQQPDSWVKATKGVPEDKP
jgi:hypothetical protein